MTTVRPDGAGYSTEYFPPTGESTETSVSLDKQPRKRHRTANPIPRKLSDRPIPTKGFPATRYSLYRAIGKAHLVPKLSKVEQLEVDIRTFEAMLAELAVGPQITVCFVNIKGGASKTTTAVYVGSAIANVTRRLVWIVPATQATTTSTMGLNTGVAADESLSVSEFYDQDKHSKGPKGEDLSQYRAATAKVKPTKAGLRVLLQDQSRGIDKGHEFTSEKFTSVIETLEPYADVILLDGGNDDIIEGSVVLEAARRSDVVVFTGTQHSGVTLQMLQKTISQYSTDSDGSNAVAVKLAQPFVVISGVKKRDKLSETLQDNQTVLTVPWDSYIGQEPTQPADIDQINSRTYLAYLKVAVAIYQQARLK